MERPNRNPQEKGLQNQARRHNLPGQDAAQRTLKKSEGAGSLGQLASALTNSRPASDINARVAVHIAHRWQSKTPATLTPTDIHELRQDWTRDLAHPTLYAYNKALRRFLAYVDTHHATHHASHVPRMPQPQPRKKTCTDKDFANILAHSPTWLRIFLQLCRTLGLRHNEATTLKPTALNEDTATLIFDRKNWGTSDLPLTDELLCAIRFCKTQNPDAPILQTLGAPSTTKAIYDAFQRAIKTAGTDPTLHIHDLRRTAATRLYTQTRDLRIVQQFLGHRQLSATFAYLAPLPKSELAQAITNAAPADLYTMKPTTEVKQ